MPDNRQRPSRQSPRRQRQPSRQRPSRQRQRTSRQRRPRPPSPYRRRGSQDIESQNITDNIRQYFNDIDKEKIDFDLNYYKRRLKYIPYIVKNLEPQRSLPEIEEQMRGDYTFRRNDFKEAAKLYRDMNNHQKYRDHELRHQPIESTPSLTNSRSGGGSRSHSRGGSRSRSRGGSRSRSRGGSRSRHGS